MRVSTALPVLLATTALVAACSGATTGGAATGGAATAVPAAASPAAPAAATASASTTKGGYGASESAPPAGGAGADVAGVKLGETALGTVLVDAAGLTLYMFTADSEGSSACYEGCAATWPPLLGSGAPTLGDGLAAGDFGTIARTDGATQVTFHGLPLYYFAADKAAGDAGGQGLGGKWYVLDADGTPIK